MIKKFENFVNEEFVEMESNVNPVDFLTELILFINRGSDLVYADSLNEGEITIMLEDINFVPQISGEENDRTMDEIHISFQNNLKINISFYVFEKENGPEIEFGMNEFENISDFLKIIEKVNSKGRKRY